MPLDSFASNDLRLLPSVDALLRTKAARSVTERIGRERAAIIARRVIAELRAEISELDKGIRRSANGDSTAERARLLLEATRELERVANLEAAQSLRRVINATGVVLHTNLGRAPLSEAARDRISAEAAGYCALEIDLETGGRGRRGARTEELLTQLTGAEAALIVNNCAAATLLVLAAIARDGECIISRGELVEIGGDFRIPDVMRASATRMIEVGTTNRTRAKDYEEALTSETRLICRVHPSNFRIIGFTRAPTVSELAEVARKANVPLYEDAGSGALLDLQPFGLGDEPVIRDSINQGADIVSFSGDKLMGGAQAGLIVGRSALIERLRRNPLARALRADKLTLAALEATLDAYAREAAFTEIPALRMIALSAAEIEHRARRIVDSLNSRSPNGAFHCELIEGRSAIGGGSAPTVQPPTVLIAIMHKNLSPSEFQDKLRRESNPPVIARVLNERLVLDLRTVSEQEEDELIAALCRF
jgi:L-seryl-tRNA(Ser) seleniumtransferase